MPNTTAAATCERCNGTGQYHGTRLDGSSYIGRCFACQGYRPSGHRSYRTGTVAAPDAPARSSGLLTVPAGQPAPVLGVARGVAACTAFAAVHPAEYDWLVAQSAAGVNFAASLLSGLQRYGNLTPRQLAAVQRNLGQVEQHIEPAQEAVAAIAAASAATVDLIDRPAERAAAIIERITPITIDMSQIFAAFDAAAASGLRKVRLTLGNIELRRTGERFRHGSGNVMIYLGGQYRGYVSRDNVFHLGVGRVLTPTEADLVRAAVADPQSAARTHGQDTGRCACCSRLLTDPVSVMQSIGPICAQRFNWSF